MYTQKPEYLVYARKSTDDQINQKNSIPYQIDACQKFAETHELKLADVTVENVVEGGIFAEKHTAYKAAELELAPDGTVTYQIERPKFQMMAQMSAQSADYPEQLIRCLMPPGQHQGDN